MGFVLGYSLGAMASGGGSDGGAVINACVNGGCVIEPFPLWLLVFLIGIFVSPLLVLLGAFLWSWRKGDPMLPMSGGKGMGYVVAVPPPPFGPRPYDKLIKFPPTRH